MNFCLVQIYYMTTVVTVVVNRVLKKRVTSNESNILGSQPFFDNDSFKFSI